MIKFMVCCLTTVALNDSHRSLKLHLYKYKSENESNFFLCRCSINTQIENNVTNWKRCCFPLYCKCTLKQHEAVFHL